MRVIEHILSTIAPHECLACGKEGQLLCAICAAGSADALPRCYQCQNTSEEFATCGRCLPNTSLYSARALKIYGGSAKELVHMLKFERARGAADVIAQLMTPALADLPQNTLVTHVPTATRRARMRGYDQAQLIARQLAVALGLEYAVLLARSGQARQVGKTRAQRQEQLRGQFAAVRPHIVQNRSILLIDDVITTGSTLEACANTLQKAGAHRIDVAVFAAA